MLARIFVCAWALLLIPPLVLESIAEPTLPALETPLQLQAELISDALPSESAIQLPDRMAVDPEGHVLLADTRSQALTKLDSQGDVMWTILGGQAPLEGMVSLADLAVGPDGRIFVLDTASRWVRVLSPRGKGIREISLQSLGRRIAVNRFGELVVNVWGPHLFEIYSTEGRLLRKFGEKIEHGDGSLDFELNAGPLATGSKGEVYIAFPYPAAVRAYSREGELLWQRPIELGRSLPKPAGSISREGEGIRAYFEYVVPSLGLDVDEQGRLLCLVSGELKSQSVKRGARRLERFAPDGERLPPVPLPQAAHRLGVRGNAIYLLTQFPNIALKRFSLAIDG